MPGPADPYTNQMDHRANDASKEKCQNDQLPSKDQTTGCHQFDIAAANGSPAADQIDHQQNTADTKGSDQMRHPCFRLHDNSRNAQYTQENINRYRDFICPPVNQTQHDKG